MSETEANGEDIQNNNPFVRLTVFVFFFVVLWYGYDFVVNYKLTSDAVEQYEIIERTGDKVAACRKMDSVISTYLYVKDEKNYNKWLKKKEDECKYFN